MAKEKFIKLSVAAHQDLVEQIRRLTAENANGEVARHSFLQRLDTLEALNSSQAKQLTQASRDCFDERYKNDDLREQYRILGRNFIRLHAVVQSCAPAVKMPDLEEMKTKDGKSWP